MIPLLGFLCLVHCVQYVTSQITMTESGPGTVKPSETLEVTCKVTGASLTDSTNMYAVHWIRQSEGKQLKWLGVIWYNDNKNYASSVQERITLTRKTNTGEVFLKLTGMKAEESGTYHCTRELRDIVGWGYLYYFDIWGPGTFVTVSPDLEKGPSLFPLISCGTSQKQSVTFGCLARDFLPNDIEFSWTDKDNSSIKEGIRTFNPTFTSGTYTASSQVKVKAENGNNHLFYCTAKHPSTKTTKTVAVGSVKVEPKEPTVTIHPPITDDVQLNGKATIVCRALGFFPNDINVSWTKNHNSPVNATTEEAIPAPNETFMITSYITVSKKEWDDDNIYSCIVKHAQNDPEIKNVSKSTVCESTQTCGTCETIKVTVEAPSFETIYLQNTAPLTCKILNMESKDGLEVSWYSGKEKIQTVIEDPVYDNVLRKFHARAIASVCPEDWKTKTFVCSVSHPELASVTNVSLSKSNGPLNTPTILLYQPHQEELAKKETATLTCMVKGFSPPDIMVKWMDSDNVEQSSVVTTEPKEINFSSTKKYYFLYSTLTISFDEWNSGKSYACVIGHESLPLHTAQKSTDKNASKPTNMNVSLIMSDTC